jgi:hypothetical protein
MKGQNSKIVPLVLYIIWIALWGGTWRILRGSEFAFSFQDVSTAFWTGLGFLIGYYAFHRPTGIAHQQDSEAPLVVSDQNGYWRVQFDNDDDSEICFARETEKDSVPRMSKSSGIGRARCLLLDTSALSMDEESRVWVWLETIVKPSELETYNGSA